jgi:hypothetical protein
MVRQSGPFSFEYARYGTHCERECGGSSLLMTVQVFTYTPLVLQMIPSRKNVLASAGGFNAELVRNVA